MKRQEFVTALVTKMKEIIAQEGNAYKTSIGANCFEWYEKPLHDTQYPALVIRDTDNECQEVSGSFEHKLEIEIDIATRGKKPMVDMREAISDVLLAFKEFRDSINYECSFSGSKSLIEQKDFTYGGTRMVFSIKYSTPAWEH
jgi:hypothetical protein